MKKLKRAAYGLIGAFTISTIGFSCAYALEVPILKDSPLAEVFDQWQQQFTSLNKYISSILSRKLEPLAESLGGDLQAAIDDAMGVLGLPDSTEAREKVEDIAASANSAVNTVEKTTNEVDRQITRADSSATLSKAGQQRTKEQVEKTQTSIEQVYTDADAAQGEVVTQNVMVRLVLGTEPVETIGV